MSVNLQTLVMTYVKFLALMNSLTPINSLMLISIGGPLGPVADDLDRTGHPSRVEHHGGQNISVGRTSRKGEHLGEGNVLAE